MRRAVRGLRSVSSAVTHYHISPVAPAAADAAAVSRATSELRSAAQKLVSMHPASLVVVSTGTDFRRSGKYLSALRFPAGTTDEARASAYRDFLIDSETGQVSHDVHLDPGHVWSFETTSDPAVGRESVDGLELAIVEGSVVSLRPEPKGPRLYARASKDRFDMFASRVVSSTSSIRLGTHTSAAEEMATTIREAAVTGRGFDVFVAPMSLILAKNPDFPNHRSAARGLRIYSLLTASISSKELEAMSESDDESKRRLASEIKKFIALMDREAPGLVQRDGDRIKVPACACTQAITMMCSGDPHAFRDRVGLDPDTNVAAVFAMGHLTDTPATTLSDAAAAGVINTGVQRHIGTHVPVASSHFSAEDFASASASAVAPHSVKPDGVEAGGDPVDEADSGAEKPTGHC